MYDEKALSEFIGQDAEKVFKPFLLFLRGLYEDYLKGIVTDLELSNSTVHWLVVNDQWSNLLVRIDKRVSDLKFGLDVTHPDFSRERKEKIVKKLINTIDEILKSKQ